MSDSHTVLKLEDVGLFYDGTKEKHFSWMHAFTHDIYFYNSEITLILNQ
jgi:hypothetical protein